MLTGLDSSPFEPNQTHVCFFREAAAELSEANLDVVYVPYAFSGLRVPNAKQEARVTYTGEVDIGDDCFHAVGISARQADELSVAAWGWAEKVARGDMTMFDADRAIPGQLDLTSVQITSTLRWAVRNRVRFLLLKEITDALPGRVALRGSDWRRLGFDAASTSFRRRARLKDYRRYRVALDLGSKSTNALLYPRTADIMAMSGGIVQFDLGAPLDEWTAALVHRRARSGTELASSIDRLLSLPAAELTEENREIQRFYAQARLDSGQILVDAIMERMGSRGAPA